MSKNIYQRQTQVVSPRGRAPSGQGSPTAVYSGPLASGLNRRAFLRTSAAISLLAGLVACKPEPPKNTAKIKLEPGKFSTTEEATLMAVQMQLFPADGDGPSAKDLNALAYLKWALTDPGNVEDGDQAYIIKGLGWLEDLAEQTKGDAFASLGQEQQHQVITQVARSSEGENWLSLLVYYLTEALCLDPIYGGNPDGIGWQWLEHQPGFPRPQNLKQGYRSFR